MRFRSGEFVMIGLETQTKPILRPYSIASPLWDEELEFYSIKAPNGALTSRLQNVKIGEPVLVRSKPTGTLVLDALAGGRNCYLVATGTGIAPFASLLRDPIIYEKFERVILTHTGRTKKDLAYGEDVMRRVSKDALVGAEAREKLLYYGTTTREPSPVQGRITDLIVSGDMFAHLELPNLSGQDRLMICGSMGLNRDMKEICQNAGLQEGSNSRPGSFLVEKAFIG